MNKKRQMWLNFCLLWGALWTFLGVFIWPFLFMAAISFLMMLLPVGVGSDEPATKPHDPDSWRTDQSRPWNHT